MSASTDIIVNVRGKSTDLKNELAKASGLIKGFGAKGGGRGGGFGFGGGFNPQILVQALQMIQVNFNIATGSAKKFDAELKNKKKDADEAGKALAGFRGGLKSISTSLAIAGKRLAWFGFRLTMIGRMFSRNLTKAIRKTTGVFKNWDRTIQSIAIGMGFLAASGMLTGKAQTIMTSAIQQAPGVGMQLQGVMEALQAVFVNIGADVLPIITGALLDLMVAISDVWATNKDQFIPIIEKIANETIPRLIEVIQKVGPEAIEGFISGIKSGVESLTNLIDKFEDWMPKIASTAGSLMGMAPVLTALGLAFFGLSVVMQTAAIGVGGFNTILGVNKTKIKEVQTVVKGLIKSLGPTGLGTIGIVIGLLAALYFWWDELANYWNKIVQPGIDRLTEAFNKMGIKIDWATTLMTFLKGASIPFALALEGLMLIFRGLIELIIAFGNALTWVGQAVSGPIKWLSNLFGGAVDNMADSNQGSPTTITQTIPIDMQIAIGSVTGDADIDELTDRISRELADKIEGVRP